MDMTIIKSETIKTDKGFFIGDPCYLFDESWSGIVDELWDGDVQGSTVNLNNVNNKDFKLGMASTSYGDGSYSDEQGNEYSVDAGLIGITPLEVVEKDEDDYKHLGLIIHMQGESTLESADGVITITFKDDKHETIIINTKEDDLYDEDEEYWDHEDFFDNWL